MEPRTLGRLLAPLARRLDNLLARAVVAAVGVGKLQSLQLVIRAGEVKDGVEHFEAYGYTSHPHPGAEAVVVFLGGYRSHGIAVTVADRRYRLQVAPGEVAVHDDLGQRVHLTRAGIVVAGAGLPVTVTATPRVRIETGRLEVTGDVIDRCDGEGITMQAMRDIYNAHTHPEPDGGTGVPNQSM